jgi:lipopolysaccharide transport system permease protein
MLVPLNFMSTSVSKLPVPQDALRDGTSAPADPSNPPPTETELAALPPEHDEAEVRETVIEPRKGWIGIDWAELRRSRELLYFLVWRDIKVRYKQATLGVLWAVLVPVIQVTIFSVIFGSGLNLASQLGMAPKAYPIYIFSAMLAWQLIARSLSDGGMSLVNQQHLLTKIYFPRMFVPTASIGGALFDFCVALPVFIGAMCIFKVVPSWTAVFLPLLVLQTAMLGAGMAYLLSALTVTYRDFRFIIPFMVQIWMWVSFVMIPVPRGWIGKEKFEWLCHLNPVYGLVSTYRRVLMDLEYGWTPTYLLSSIAITIGIFVLGLFYFRKTERRFADIA